MIYDGIEFESTTKYVTLPKEYWLGNDKNYMIFGEVCSRTDEGAIKTIWGYAKKVFCSGHSDTNVMHGEDKVFMFYGGMVYIRSLKGCKK